jgi:large subunit ribosomal protein L17
MRHLKSQSKLGKPTDARLAVVRGQVAKLFEHGFIDTTLPRSRAVRQVAERLITRAKRGDLAAIRTCARHLPGKAPLRALLRKVIPGVTDVQSGYTQTARLKYRRGDGALIVRLSIRNYPLGEGGG